MSNKERPSARDVLYEMGVFIYTGIYNLLLAILSVLMVFIALFWPLFATSYIQFGAIVPPSHLSQFHQIVYSAVEAVYLGLLLFTSVAYLRAENRINS